MSHHVIEYDEQCKHCSGSGLYIGMAEKSGAAVVCHTCEGTGSHHVVTEYDDFVGRLPPTAKVLRVIQSNPGIGIGNGNGHRIEDFGGMPYADWEKGKAFPKGSEMRRFVCPAWWYQGVQYDLKPDWAECGWGSFSQCKSFPTKARCWERFDREHPELAPKP